MKRWNVNHLKQWETCIILIHWNNWIIIPLIIKELSLISISPGTDIVGWELAWAINPKYRIYRIQLCHIWQPGNGNQLWYYIFNGDNQREYRRPACTLVPCNQFLESCMWYISTVKPQRSLSFSRNSRTGSFHGCWVTSRFINIAHSPYTEHWS